MTETFLPDPARAATLTAAIVRHLAESLGLLAAACDGAPGFDAGAVARHAAGLRATPRLPPAIFLRYHDALDAARRDDPEALATTLRACCGPLGAAQPVRGFADSSLDSLDWQRFQRALDAQTEATLPIAGVTAANLDAAAARLAAAKEAIALADQALAKEIDILVAEVVFARTPPGAARSFGGATCFQAWGAILLNAQRHASVVAMVAGLVHEAAHTLLMAHSSGAPMVANAPGERYPSPLRADKRPMDGIFHATFVSARIVYAMDRLLAVENLDAIQANEARQVRAASGAAFDSGHAVVAAHARPTASGAAAMSGALAYMRARRAGAAPARSAGLSEYQVHAVAPVDVADNASVGITLE